MIHRTWYGSGIFLLLMCTGILPVAAATAPFNLTGPRLEVQVTRAGRTLPISEVPNLQAGDQLWLHPDMPDNQSVHYLLIPVFLRGSLNPPPANWFTKVETWRPRVRRDGVHILVPEGALEALIFWAPETSGGYTTVRTAVRARPGVFVRAAQDLYAADLTRSRLDAYLGAVKQIAATDPDELQKRAKLLAQTLYLKINTACFDLPTDQQENCLIQDPGSVVLNDTQSQSMVTALTSGAAGDMINQLSASTAAGGGMYSPYVGAIVDMVRIMGSLHTAQYAYIPAIAVMRDQQVDLKLSSPPSFINPKSVMVSSLPPVVAAQFPSLRATHPQDMLCLERPSLVLSVEGAPLVFSTDYAHDLSLRVQDVAGRTVELPTTPNAERGGFVVDAKALQSAPLSGGVTGHLQGEWGFDSYDGPTFAFTNSHQQTWTFPGGETSAVTAGDKVALRLQAESVVCVQSVSVTTPERNVLKADWKPVPPRLIEVNLPLKKSSQGIFTVAVAQYGQSKSDSVQVHAYPPSATITGVDLHAGDTEGVMTGSRLDEVSTVEMGGVVFHPGKLQHEDAEDKLQFSTIEKLTPKKSKSAALQAGTTLPAHIHLKDGRVLDFPVTIAPARPQVLLLSKSIALSTSSAASLIHLGNDNDLPQYGRMTFFLKSVAPAEFPRDEKIEVAAANGGFDTMLSLANGSLTLQDSQTLLAVLDPAKSFGTSAFGQLRFRPVTGTGVPGDWQPLANLVRLPSLKEVRCPVDTVQSCTMLGDNLFLIDAVSNTAQFANPVSVPMGFAGSTMKVPRPNGTTLYLKLRDDPATVDLVALPVYPEVEQY